jgi:hypothetical protein
MRWNCVNRFSRATSIEGSFFADVGQRQALATVANPAVGILSIDLYVW